MNAPISRVLPTPVATAKHRDGNSRSKDSSVDGHLIPREFLRVIRADPTGFVQHLFGNLRSSWSWVGAVDPNGGNRPTADIAQCAAHGRWTPEADTDDLRREQGGAAGSGRSIAFPGGGKFVPIAVAQRDVVGCQWFMGTMAQTHDRGCRGTLRHRRCLAGTVDLEPGGNQ
jgi:hypothetical protein